MKRLLTVVVALSTVALVGCEQEPKTVDYYVANQDEMDRVLDDCKNKAINPFGESKEAQNCRAAADAQTQIFFTLPWENKKEELKNEESQGSEQDKEAVTNANTETKSVTPEANSTPAASK